MKRRFAPLLSVLGFAVLAGCSVPAPGPLKSARIAQFDVGMKGQELYFPASDWGRLAVTFQGAAQVLYLNLNVNGKWVIRNLRVHSVEGAGKEQTITVAFGLGNARGQRLDRVDHGISLTATPADAMPPASGSMAVVPETLNELCTGGDGKDGLPPAPGAVVGGEQDKKEGKHVNSGFVNQDAPRLGCVQTAFSNSLQWLKKNNPSLSGVKDDDISIGALGTAVGASEATGTPDGFIAKKRDHLAAKGIPIDTTEVSVADVGKKIDEKCDVEMWTQGSVKHFAAVVGISKGADGKYSIDVAHDTDQGNVGGAKTETVTYDPAADKISGGTWLNDAKVLTFVVECPRKT
jgi:hypothetical protein